MELVVDTQRAKDRERCNRVDSRNQCSELTRLGHVKALPRALRRLRVVEQREPCNPGGHDRANHGKREDARELSSEEPHVEVVTCLKDDGWKQEERKSFRVKLQEVRFMLVGQGVDEQPSGRTNQNGCSTSRQPVDALCIQVMASCQRRDDEEQQESNAFGAVHWSRRVHRRQGIK